MSAFRPGRLPVVPPLPAVSVTGRSTGKGLSNKMKISGVRGGKMADSYIRQCFARRIGGSQFGQDTVMYKFEKIKRAKQMARQNKPDMELIDLGVGEPDWMAEPEGSRFARIARLSPHSTPTLVGVGVE